VQNVYTKISRRITSIIFLKQRRGITFIIFIDKESRDIPAFTNLPGDEHMKKNISFCIYGEWIALIIGFFYWSSFSTSDSSTLEVKGIVLETDN